MLQDLKTAVDDTEKERKDRANWIEKARLRSNMSNIKAQETLSEISNEVKITDRVSNIAHNQWEYLSDVQSTLKRKAYPEEQS